MFRVKTTTLIYTISGLQGCFEHKNTQRFFHFNIHPIQQRHGQREVTCCRYCLHYVSLMQRYAADLTHAERMLEQRTPRKCCQVCMYCSCAVVGRHVAVFPNRLLFLSCTSLEEIKGVCTQKYRIYTLPFPNLFSPDSLKYFFHIHSYNTANAEHLAQGVINRCDNSKNKCQLQPENTVRNWPIKILCNYFKSMALDCSPEKKEPCWFSFQLFHRITLQLV